MTNNNSNNKNKKQHYVMPYEKLRKEAIKDGQKLNSQLRGIVVKTTLFAGVVASLKYCNNTEQNISEAEVVKPVSIEEIQKNYEKYNPEMFDIDELLNDYNSAYTIEDVKEVNELYSGQYIELTGEIKNEYIGSVDGDFITLQGEESKWMSVQCNIEDKLELEELKEYKVGDDITIQGYCVGGNGLSVKINDCIIK
jgi:hypothetical protein